MPSRLSSGTSLEGLPGMALMGQLMEWLSHNARYRLVRRLYHRHEAVAPPALFLGGVGWDALTLERVGAWSDNVILGGYLVLLGGAIALALLDRHLPSLPAPLQALTPWALGAIQFFTGGLFSAYVIYYTRSASFTSASLFLLVLVGLLVANEFVWGRERSSYLLVGLYFLAVSCYLTFLLPLLTGQMGTGIFLTSSALSAGLVVGLLLLLRPYGVFGGQWAFRGALGMVGALCTGLLTFYAQSWIPPVPLALQHAGVYHDVTRSDGAFLLRHETSAGLSLWRASGDDPFRYAPGDTVHCFTAIYAPVDFEARVAHRWQRYVPAREAWVETDRIPYRVTGGRRTGYRGVTYKTHMAPGQWRVRVETARGRPIGRVAFEVVADSSQAPSFTTHRYE